MKKNKKIVIIGGGPTGLGAAYRLYKLEYKNWVLYEKESCFGGLSSTCVDSKGFLWDKGGHILFSHFKYFDRFIKEVLQSKYLIHQRESWIKLLDNWVPYPFQNNLRYLKPNDQLACLLGLLEAKKSRIIPKNFRDWILKIFGEGIAEAFMNPYNFKVWATPLIKMDKDWIAERVSIVDFKKVLENIILRKDDIFWGPNNTFKFSEKGGTGAIYRDAAKLINGDLKKNREIVGVDLKNKSVFLRDGTKDKYDYLINTSPLDKFVNSIKNPAKDIKAAANKLLANNVLVIGLGLEKPIKTSKCWVYFPTKDVPFYRLTFFHNYSPNNVPDGNIKKYSSLMCEIAYSDFKKIDKKKVVNDSINALIKNKILDKEDRNKIISKNVYDIPYAYPVPTLERDKILRKIQPFLLKNKIYSRGRFGAWKYEIGNMDHSFMQGVEVINNILKNKKETLWSL